MSDKLTVFVVLVNDRHCDEEVHVFGPTKVLDAVGYARKTALEMARGVESDMNIYLNAAMERAGWVWFASVGPEGDSVRVQAVELR